MNEADRSRQHSPDATATDIQSVRSRLVDKGLLYFGFLVPLVVGMSLARAFEHGWHNIYFLHLGISAMLIAGAVLRGRLPYRVRACLLLGFTLVAGLVGLPTFGLHGAAHLALVTFAIMVTIAFGTRAGLIACAVDLVILAGTGVAVTTGAITFSIDMGEYATSITAWGLVIAAFFFLVPVIVIALGAVHTHLVKTLGGLRKSEAALAQAQGMAHIGNWDWNPETGEMIWSDEVYRLLGYQPQEFKPTLDLAFDPIHPDDRDRVKTTVEEALKKNTGYSTEYRAVLPDGQTRTLVSLVEVKKDDSGKVAFFGTLQDITERKEAEKSTRYRLELERLGNEISTTFVNVGAAEIDKAIKSALGKIANFAKANRGSLFVFSDDLETITNTHEWCANPEDSQIAALKNIPFSTFGWHRDLLLGHKTIALSKLDDYPPEAKGERQWVEAHGFRALLFIPLLKNGRLCGALGIYGETGKEVAWSSELTDMLKTVGNLVLNVLERKHSAVELRNSEETHRGLIENLPQQIFHKDANLVYVSCNRHFARDLGIAPDEVAGKTDFDLYPREIANKYREEDRRVMESGQTEEIEESFIKNGQELWVHTVKTPVTDDSGVVTGILGMFWDITERKQAEEALRESEQRLSTHLQNTPIVAIEWNMDFEVVEWNAAAERVFGYSKDEALGKHAVGLVVPESARKHVDKVWNDLFENKGGLHSTNENFTKDGRTIVCEWNNTLLFDKSGKVCGVASLVQDITERKQAEGALRASEEKFRKYITAAPDGIFVADAEGRYVEVNQAACDLTGYTETELTSMTIPDIIEREPHTGILESFGNLKMIGKHTKEFKLRRKDGSVIWASLDAVALSEDRFMAFCSDLTETKRLQTLESRAERLETAGTIAGQVAHDFNNLLAPLVAYPDFIREELPTGHPALAYIDDIENSALQIAEINQQLLTLGRRGHYTQKALSMNTIVYQAIRELSPLPKTMTIETELDENLMNFKGGGSQIHRVLSNLLTNAMEAMQDVGRILIKTECHYADDLSIAYGRVPKGEYVKLTVSDTGCGIPDDILQSVFDPFFTSKTTDKKRGSGLGLSVVDAVVKDHKGYLDLTTKVGVGTSFYLYFPVCRENTEAEEVENLAGGVEKVLIVDDDEIQREVSQCVLKKLGYQVSSVDSGEKAIELLRENPQDIIILDMVMPGGIDGAETYRQMLEISPHQKAIILSGYSESGRVLEAQKLGAGAFVKKPVTRGTIAAAVRKELERVVSVAS